MEHKLYTRLYRALLRLYPRHFQSEFADEMLQVFAELVGESAAGRPFTLVKTVLTELSSLPGEALRQHLNGIQDPEKAARPRDARWEGPPSSKEMLITLAIFVLPAVNILLNLAPAVSVRVLVWLMALLFLAVLFAGVLRGFPRWSLPYLGLALSVASFLFLFQWAADLVAPSMLSRLTPAPHDESTWLLLQAFWAGLMWFSLFVLTFLVLGVLALLRRFRSLSWRIQQDWTIMSYILYAGAMFTLLLAFDQYRYKEPYAIASTLCLTTGAWLYLRSSKKWQRTLALLTGLTLAVSAAVAGQLPIVPDQDWRLWLAWHPPESERWFEARRTILEWGWMVLFILAPSWLRLFSKPDGGTPIGS